MNKEIKVCFFGTYDRGFTSNKIVLDGLKRNGVEVLEINSEIKLTKLDKEGDMTWWKLIERILKKYKLVSEVVKNAYKLKKYQVIYVGFPGHVDVFPAWIVAKIFNLKLVFNPLVVIYTGYADDQGLLKKESLMGVMIKYFEGLCYKLCDLVTADTPYQKDHLIKEFGVPEEKIDVLPIGADDVVYPYSPKPKNEKDFNVVYYGLYTPLHGVEYIVEAANILKDDKKIKFLMIGNGHTFDENYKKAQELGLKNMIFYKDMTEHNALKTLSKADVFLGFLQKHPSVDRIVPNKVYQGLALGKAVITARAPAITTILDDRENVMLCNQSDGKDLARAIKELKNNPTLKNKIAKKGYDLYVKEFTPISVGKILIDFMKKVLYK